MLKKFKNGLSFTREIEHFRTTAIAKFKVRKTKSEKFRREKETYRSVSLVTQRYSGEGWRRETQRKRGNKNNAQ